MNNKPLDAWQKQRIIDLAAQEIKTTAIAERLGLNLKTVQKVIQVSKNKSLNLDKD